MKKLRILTTGGSGFIGRHIVGSLKSKYQIIVPSHRQLDLTNADKVNNFFKKNKYFDIVIHAANVGGKRNVADNTQTLLTNLSMFFNIVANDQFFGRLINLGSGAEYGKQEPIKMVVEDDFGKRVPVDYYGLAKYICGQYIEKADKIVNLRLFAVFGPGEDYQIRFISNAICKNILRRPITINQNVSFDYLYIYDFIKILDYFINHAGRHKTYNVGRGTPIDLLTLAKKINRIAPQKSKIIIRHRGLGTEYTCDNRRLLKEIGDFPFTDLDSAVRELCQWYWKTKDRLDKKSLLTD